ncbi:Secreted protein OS=Streptomyces fumanus OX=67302 GN=GCM10018772_61870 PE=4 SV=1 [Streptomyces fumanus]
MIFALLNTDLAKCLTTGIELVAGPTDLTILSLWLTP